MKTHASNARVSPQGMLMPNPQAAIKFANAPPPGLTTRANAPRLPGGEWALLELIDALLPLANLHKLLFFVCAIHRVWTSKKPKVTSKETISVASLSCSRFAVLFLAVYH